MRRLLLPQNSPMPLCRYYSTAGATLGAEAIFDFGTKDYDPLNCVATGVSWAFTAPWAGYYSVSAFILTQSVGWTATNALALAMRKSGIAYCRLGYKTIDANVTTLQAVGGSASIYLLKGETVALYLASSQTVAAGNGTGDCHVQISYFPGV